MIPIKKIRITEIKIKYFKNKTSFLFFLFLFSLSLISNLYKYIPADYIRNVYVLQLYFERENLYQHIIIQELSVAFVTQSNQFP